MGDYLTPTSTRTVVTQERTGKGIKLGFLVAAVFKRLGWILLLAGFASMAAYIYSATKKLNSIGGIGKTAWVISMLLCFAGFLVFRLGSVVFSIYCRCAKWWRHE